MKTINEFPNEKNVFFSLYSTEFWQDTVKIFFKKEDFNIFNITKLLVFLYKL